MSLVQFVFAIFRSFTFFVLICSQENDGQKPIPIFAEIIFFTAIGLSLSKTIFGC
jgi:hypothetical protein